MSDVSEAERALKHAANRTANVLYAHMVSEARLADIDITVEPAS